MKDKSYHIEGGQDKPTEGNEPKEKAQDSEIQSFTSSGI